MICAATHFLSQEEVDTGTIVNMASANGAARDKDGTEASSLASLREILWQ